jgi:hypothetical protein
MEIYGIINGISKNSSKIHGIQWNFMHFFLKFIYAYVHPRKCKVGEKPRGFNFIQGLL